MYRSSHINWFFSFIFCKLENEKTLDFWRHSRLESSSFDVLFPSLFRYFFGLVLKWERQGFSQIIVGCGTLVWNGLEW